MINLNVFCPFERIVTILNDIALDQGADELVVDFKEFGLIEVPVDANIPERALGFTVSDREDWLVAPHDFSFQLRSGGAFGGEFTCRYIPAITTAPLSAEQFRGTEVGNNTGKDYVAGFYPEAGTSARATSLIEKVPPKLSLGSRPFYTIICGNYNKLAFGPQSSLVFLGPLLCLSTTFAHKVTIDNQPYLVSIPDDVAEQLAFGEHGGLGAEETVAKEKIGGSRSYFTKKGSIVKPFVLGQNVLADGSVCTGRTLYNLLSVFVFADSLIDENGTCDIISTPDPDSPNDVRVCVDLDDLANGVYEELYSLSNNVIIKRVLGHLLYNDGSLGVKLAHGIQVVDLATTQFQSALRFALAVSFIVANSAEYSIANHLGCLIGFIQSKDINTARGLLSTTSADGSILVNCPLLSGNLSGVIGFVKFKQSEFPKGLSLLAGDLTSTDIDEFSESTIVVKTDDMGSRAVYVPEIVTVPQKNFIQSIATDQQIYGVLFKTDVIPERDFGVSSSPVTTEVETSDDSETKPEGAAELNNESSEMDSLTAGILDDPSVQIVSNEESSEKQEVTGGSK